MKHVLYTMIAITALLFTGCADAGKNQTVTGNTKVFFDVSGVKPDLGGKITKYNWELTGDAASIYDIFVFNNGTDHASFIAPNVSKETKLTFKLTSIESYKCKTEDDSSCKHRKSTDKVKITVTKGSADNNNTNKRNSVTLTGKIKTLSNGALSGAVVTVSGQTDTTRNDGTYRLNNLKSDERAIINVSHPDYFDNTRIVLINQSGSYAQDVKLGKENITVSFEAQQGRSIADNHASINFEPGEYIDITGKKYIDNVTVKMSYYNFKKSTDTSAFVGSYETTNGTTESPLNPHGFINMAIADSSGNALKVDSDTVVKLVFPAADVDSNDASIPLWFYNKKLGYWLQDGTATRNNNQYIAQVTRMATWGLFTQASKGSIQICVVDGADKALSDVNVRLTGDNWSSNLIQTDTEGFAVINTIRADVKLTITASKLIGTEKVSANYSKKVTLSAGDNINLDDCIVLESETDKNTTAQIERDAAAKKEKEEKEKADKEKAEQEREDKEKETDTAKLAQLEKDAEEAREKADDAKKDATRAQTAVSEAKKDVTAAKAELLRASADKKTAAEEKVKTTEATLKTKEAEAKIAKENAEVKEEKAKFAEEKLKDAKS